MRTDEIRAHVKGGGEIQPEDVLALLSRLEAAEMVCEAVKDLKSWRDQTAPHPVIDWSHLNLVAVFQALETWAKENGRTDGSEVAMEREHITNGKPCWCSPRMERQEDGPVLVIHNRLPECPKCAVLRAELSKRKVLDVATDAVVEVTRQSIIKENEVLAPYLEMKARAEKAESERDSLRAELSAEREKVRVAEAQIKLLESGEHPDYPYKRALEMCEDARLALAGKLVLAVDELDSLKRAIREIKI